jgi:hypothetical protein
MGEPRRFLTYAVILGWVALFAVILLQNSTREPKENRGRNSCINNLRMIDAAIQQWALENSKTNSDIPTWGNLKEYLGRDGTWIPKCPLGGTYTLRTVGEKPTCSYSGHVLP